MEENKMPNKEDIRKRLDGERKQLPDLSHWPAEWRSLLDLFAAAYGTYNFAKTPEYHRDFGEYNPETGEYELPWE